MVNGWDCAVGGAVRIRICGMQGLPGCGPTTVGAVRIPYCVAHVTQQPLRNAIPPSCTSDFPAHRDSVSPRRGRSSHYPFRYTKWPTADPPFRRALVAEFAPDDFGEAD